MPRYPSRRLIFSNLTARLTYNAPNGATDMLHCHNRTYPCGWDRIHNIEDVCCVEISPLRNFHDHDSGLRVSVRGVPFLDIFPSLPQQQRFVRHY